MRKKLSMLILLVLSCGVLLAQKTISGRVTDQSGLPLPNVSVVVKGKSIGTITQENGTYTFVIPDDSRVLVFSGIDKKTVEETIRDRSTINVILQDDDKSMEEVVVVGYGVQSRKELTGSVVSVKGAVIADKPVQSFEATLQGRAAGVQITVPNGVLNNPPVFRVRGTNSINLSSQPLIVIDGMVTFTGDGSSTLAAANVLSNINPSDIESVDILKDAAATAIYGSRAANGVVVITTKKGKKGRAKLSYDGWVGFTSPVRQLSMMNAEQYMMLKNEGLRNGGGNDAFFPSYDSEGKLVDVNWQDVVYREAVSHNHSINVSGANETTSYYFSVGYTDQEGIVKTNHFDRKTVRFNADHKATQWLTFGVNASYVNDLNATNLNTGSLSGQAYNSAGVGRLALSLPPNVPVYNNDGSYNIDGNTIGNGANLVNITFMNPQPMLDLNYSNTENNRFIGNFYFMARPVKNLIVRSSYGIDYLQAYNKNFYNAIQGDGQSNGGSAFSTLNVNKRWTWTTTAQYDRTILDNHNISALIGTEQQKSDNEGFGLSRQTLSDQFFTIIQGGFATPNATGLGFGENYLGSYFGRLNYDYDKKYFIGASFRRDGYSAFAPDLKWGNFYSVSGAWDIAKESFWQGGIGDVVNSFKLRASHGTTGNISGIGNYAASSFYSGTGLYNGSPTLNFSQAGNPLLTWESSKKTDIGFSFGLLNDRISGELAWYNNNIDGLILSVPNASSTGLPNEVSQNVGKMYNRGIEFTLNATPIETKDFSWTTSFNITYNKNEVTELAEGVDNIISSTAGLEATNITLPGYPIGMLYMVETRGVDPQTGRRIFVDENGEELLYDHSSAPGSRFTYRSNGQVAPNLSTDAQKPWKSPLPKYFGGWDNNFRYKNFDLNAIITYQLDFYVYNGTRATALDQRFWNSHTDALNRWQKPNDQTDIPRVVWGDNVSNGSANPITDNVEKGNFFRLRNIALGYTLPQNVTSRIGISNARFYVSGQNVGLITKYRGSDPEVSSNGTGNTSQGVDRNSVGNARIITIGLNVGF